MKRRKKNRVIAYGIILIILISFFIFFPIIIDNLVEARELKNNEWDNKYKPICDKLGGLYLEEGYAHYNYCYLNNSGILHKACMVEKLNQWYVVECSQ